MAPVTRGMPNEGLCVSLRQWNGIAPLDIFDKEKKRVLLRSMPESGLFQYSAVNCIFECYRNTFLSYRN